MWAALPSLFLDLVLFSTFTYGLRFELHGLRHSEHTLYRRGNIAGSSPLNNSADISYYTNLTLGGSQFTVLIDTGSSDLWVAGTVPNSKNTGKSSGVTYAVGAVKGPIKTAELEFAGYTVLDQAYLEITPDEENAAGTGLIGLGPNSGSNIFQTMKSSAGNAVLDRIFLQNTSTPNFLTVLLGRINDPTDVFPGDLTVGEILEGYEDVQKQPKLSVTDVPIFEVGDQHFQVLLDADGIIGPNGQSIPVSTAVDETSNKRQVTAVIDTGFSLSQVPKSVADAFYKDFSGAEYVNVTGIGKTWIVPCTEEVNITFKFSGVKYPVHPLDATLDPNIVGLRNVKNSKGQDCCIGTYQPVSFNIGNSPNFDMILGMSFLRNTYTLINFGDFVADTTNKGDPYIQFLSTTDPNEAHSDFVKVRLDGVDTTVNKGHPAESSDSNRRTLYIILAGVLAGIALLLIVGSLVFTRIRRNRLRKGSSGAAWGAYRPLSEPAPGDVHAMQPTQQYNAHAPYDPNYQNQYNPNAPYQNPWDHRY